MTQKKIRNIIAATDAAHNGLGAYRLATEVIVAIAAGTDVYRYADKYSYTDIECAISLLNWAAGEGTPFSADYTQKKIVSSQSVDPLQFEKRLSLFKEFAASGWEGGKVHCQKQISDYEQHRKVFGFALDKLDSMLYKYAAAFGVEYFSTVRNSSHGNVCSYNVYALDSQNFLRIALGADVKERETQR